MAHTFKREKQALQTRFYIGALPRQKKSVERIQHSQESLRASPGVIAFTQNHRQVEEARVYGRSPYWSNCPRVHGLSPEQEAIFIAFRKHTLLPLNDSLYALKATIPQFTAVPFIGVGSVTISASWLRSKATS